MKNNKIYTTLAHLYTQIKGVIGDSGRTLSEEIDKRVSESEEVVKARCGYNSLSHKMSALSTSVDEANEFTREVQNKAENNIASINKLREEVKELRTSNPVVELDNGEKILVSLAQRPSHKTYNFELKANEKKIVRANTENYISDLYVCETNTDNNIDFNFDENYIYDEHKLCIENGGLLGMSTGEIEVPLFNGVIAEQMYDNIVVVPELCKIQGISASNHAELNTHVIYAFKHGYVWTLKARTAELLFEFDYPIDLTTISFLFNSDDGQKSVSLYVYENDVWTLIDKVPAIDGILTANKRVKVIRVLFDSLSEREDNQLRISSISLKAKAYADNTGVSKIEKTIDVYDANSILNIVSMVDEVDTVNNKYALFHTKDTQEVHVHYPAIRSINAGEFKDRYGKKSIGSLKSTISDVRTPDYQLKDQSILGTESTLCMTNATWSEDMVVSFNNGYKYSSLNYVKLAIITETTEHEIALTQELFNKVTKLEIDGIPIIFELKECKGALKFKVSSDHIIKAVICRVYCLQNVYSSDNGTSVRAHDNSSTSIEYNPGLKVYNINTEYSCCKYHYSWSYHWLWGSVLEHKSTTYSKYNQTIPSTLVFVDNEKIDGNPAKRSVSETQEYDCYTFRIDDARSVTGYIGVYQSGYNALCHDGVISPTGMVSTLNPINEYTAILVKDVSQNVLTIVANDVCNRHDEVEYFLSNKNSVFYRFNKNTNAWVQSNVGMTAPELEEIPPTAFAKLFTGEEIHIMIRLKSVDVSVEKLTFTFDKAATKSISVEGINKYGMSLDDLTNIDSNEVYNLIKTYSTLCIFINSTSKSTLWPVVIPKLSLMECGGLLWRVANSSDAHVYVVGNNLVIENTTNETVRYKLEQKFFSDEYVAVGTREDNQTLKDITQKVSSLAENTYIIDEKIAVLDQNVQILRDIIDTGEQPPDTLPTYIIPSREVELPPLAPGDSATIDDIKYLRYIQFWDVQGTLLPEVLEYQTTLEHKMLFEYEHAEFQNDYLEMSKVWDTDVPYLMEKAISGTSTASSYIAPKYTCTATLSNGKPAIARKNIPLSNILSVPGDGVGAWYQWAWSSEHGNMIYDMPGEAVRWVDIDFTFNEIVYIHGLFNMDFGGTSIGDSFSDSRTPLDYQVTSIFLDEKGDNDWELYKQYNGVGVDVNLIINRAVAKIRIRIEVPYSHNLGVGLVAFKYIDLYECLAGYNHTKYATVKPILYHSTSLWKEILSSSIDIESDSQATDARLLFEVKNDNDDPKYLSIVDDVLRKVANTYDFGIPVHVFNKLNKDTLNALLEYDYVKILVYLKSADRHNTPKLKSIKLIYAEKFANTISMVQPQDVITRYDAQTESIVITNASNYTRTLKAIIN